MDMFCDGRHRVFRRTIGGLFRKMIEAGANLVSFNGFYTQSDNIDAWIEQAQEKYEKSCRLLDLIYKQPILDDLVRSDKGRAVNKVVHQFMVHSIDGDFKVWSLSCLNFAFTKANR